MAGVSMKRSKAVTRRARDDIEDAPTRSRAAEPEKSWSQHLEGKPDDAFVPYAMSGHFKAGSLIAHPTFGRGVVVGSVDRRIDVLFEAGKKTLTHAG
jgi:hypothetical protein